MSTSDLTPELRLLADRAVERTIAALHTALARGADPRQAPTSPLARRLARHIDSVPAPIRARLRPSRAVLAPAPARPKAVRPAFRWPAPLSGVTTPPTYTALDLRLLSLRCDDDTREAGDDDMSIGLVRVVLDHGDPVTQATDVQGPFPLGGFRKGDARTFSPPRTLTTLTPGGSARTVTSVLVLADIDLGGLGGLLAAMASGVTDELILELAQRGLTTSGAAFGATFFGTLGTIFGPAGIAAGIVIGVALGAAVGYAVGKAIEGLLQLFKDDALDPLEWTLAVPSTGPGLVETREFAFTGRHAAYTATLEWRAR